MKLCRDCIFFQEDTPQCLSPKNSHPDYVNGDKKGDPIYWFAAALRIEQGACGPDAKWFEQAATLTIRSLTEFSERLGK